ncbi:MAG: DUF2279 domain-containing protein [Bacteroidetes bacterium]|nr:DUF2279 domain-containing protein [Bacteroidota bacterium]
MRKLFFIVIFLPAILPAQNAAPTYFSSPPPDYDSKRGTAVFVAEGVLFTGALIALNHLWYKKFPRSKFHFFNDNAEWFQMDKIGHAVTAYNLGVLGMNALQYTGMKQRNAIWYGGMTGFAFLTTIEVMDGFSSDWGFSSGDMLANICGTGLAIGQQLGWNEQRLQLKFSFHLSVYAPYHPDMLGKNFWQRMLKDYNGQTYWLSGNISSFVKTNDNFPKWLNVSVGYGAEGMLGARTNPAEINGTNIPAFNRTRKFLLAPDADLSKVNTNDRGWNTALSAINFFKTPAPAIGFKTQERKLFFRPVYF